MKKIEYTPRQQKILAGLSDKEKENRQLVCYYAVDMYNFIKENTNGNLESVVHEFLELVDNSIWGGRLSKPRNKFNPITNEVYKKFKEQNQSFNVHVCIGDELKNVVRDYEKIQKDN